MKQWYLGILTAGLACAAGATEPRPPSRGHPAKLESDRDVSPGRRLLERLTHAEREALEREGQVVLDQRAPSGGASLVRAVVRFNRPKSEVFALITKPSQQSAFLPHVKVSRSRDEPTPEGESVDFVVAFLLTFKYRTQHWFYPEESRMEWNLDPTGGDGLEEQLGFWQLYELDETTTIAEYGTHLRARGALLEFLRRLGERGGVKDALTAFRRHVDTAKL